MFKWFEKWLEAAFLTRLADSDAVLAQATKQVADLRQHLYLLYHEVEQAIEGLDMLGKRIDEARQRIAARAMVQQGLTPVTFDQDFRQRDAGESLLK